MSKQIITRTGIMYDLENPNPTDIVLPDVLHALSRICRYNGHTREHYSVAEHSVRCFRVVVDWGGSVTDQISALTHDFHEAYIGDVSSPAIRCVPGWAEFELKHSLAMASRFGLPKQITELAKKADRVMLATELRDLFGHRLLGGEPVKQEIKPWNWANSYWELKHACEILGVM